MEETAMSQEKDGNINPQFSTIALKSVRDKTTAKEATLADLFKCVESLNTSTGHLKDFLGGNTDQEDGAQLETYLGGLVKIQTGLLEIAKKKVSAQGEMTPVPGLQTPEA
jgi:hypothetical protein